MARLPGVAPASLDRFALFPDRDPKLPFPKPQPKVSAVAGTLKILTLIPRVVTLAFHYVKQAPDGADGVVTARQPDAVLEDELVTEMNRIYNGQTKIRFVRQSQRVVSTGFSGPVTVGSHSFLASPSLTTNIDASARLRIFFVESIDPSEGKEIFASSQGHPFKNILCRDAKKRGQPPISKAKVLGLILAHECGHNFGIRKHPDPDPTHLMHETNIGDIIPTETAKFMNDHVVLR